MAQLSGQTPFNSDIVGLIFATFMLRVGWPKVVSFSGYYGSLRQEMWTEWVTTKFPTSRSLTLNRSLVRDQIWVAWWQPEVPLANSSAWSRTSCVLCNSATCAAASKDDGHLPNFNFNYETSTHHKHRIWFVHLVLQIIFVRVDVLSKKVDRFCATITYTYFWSHTCLFNVKLKKEKTRTTIIECQ